VAYCKIERRGWDKLTQGTRRRKRIARDWVGGGVREMRTTNPMKSLVIVLRSLQTDFGDENN